MKFMKSILHQLAKYQDGRPSNNSSIPIIEIKEAPHPYQSMVENLCDIVDEVKRKQVINDALAVLVEFTPPPMTDQLYPLELAVLYHLFYHHKISICSESTADNILGAFLKAAAARDGLDAYMQTLKNCLDKNATAIFLYRVMLAAFGARGKWDNKRDHISKEYGYKAAKALGVEPTARVAGHGLDSLARAGIEELILGRITYIAFWEWSRLKPVSECSEYLGLSSPIKLLPGPSSNT
jgi:hypothetical protein